MPNEKHPGRMPGCFFALKIKAGACEITDTYPRHTLYITCDSKVSKWYKKSRE